MIHLAELLKVREITIDTMQHKDFATKEEELKVMRFYQNDLNSAKLLINVTHDKVVTDFSTATKVQIAFLKPDGKRVFQDVQNLNQMQGKYYVVLSTQTLIAYGNVVAQLRLTFPDNKVIETCKFVFAVDESIMSDEAMKSTNEFPVIQKAIEAGEKLEGVDINGTIAAGAKADAALPKAGGTMTGNVDMDVSIGSKSKGYRWKDVAGTMYGLETSTTGELILYDYKAAARVWQYDPVGKRFSVISDGNVLKTTGGTMTGNFNFDVSSGEKSLVWRGGTTNIGFISGSTQNWRLRDWTNSKDVFSYDGKTFNVLADSNLVTKNKDGVVNLTLTADAELTGANGVIAVRRGNTVSLRAPIRRKAGSGNLAVLFTLPTDMRPVGFTVQQGIVSIDGVSAIFTVSTAGEVTIQNATATDVAGKNFYVTCTYVVD
ncbi:BppU family phage baseplate upper protein [Bacillus cereus group sp. BfR-BA-00287]|uniref:BppU family phage baseplate upper protein n=1 Tax=Bacillus cereus group sp. BfR-BA-00287 TaxID=3094865 RepID=UPI0029C56C3D|nr:BppU family phage baseplate upper protein [Bacillus cereus group sp. BfR-BA-00287]MDX5975279.1 BppU family phage baseplate upper protein [Bacillus cereus group sp. BfR-BA-00287]